jgi:tRNA 2-thiouridine synthesizing protein A
MEVIKMEVTKVVDAKGLACPMPIVRTKKAMDELKSGEVLEVHTTDHGAKNDLTAWAQSTGHELLKHEEDNGVLKFWIKKR